MASPITPSNGRALSLTPGARVLRSPLSDETIWKRLKEAGFDEESIKRRDKAALIAYIAKLEAEIFDLQHHMGLLLLERKELTTKQDDIKALAEATDLAHKRDQAALMSALAEAQKREDSLKKALGVEKECIASMEKALHEIRTESAETKVAADLRLTEARSMMEDAQAKFLDAESKLHASEALQAEASRYHRAAERKLLEVESREDDIRRRINAFKTDCDAKEKEISIERQYLSERRKALEQEQERLLDGQALLNQREDFVASRSQELSRLEMKLETSKADIEKELRAINSEKSELKLTMASLSQREESVTEKEAFLDKREKELMVIQEKRASKESVEIQKVIADQESLLRTRKSEFESEMELNRKLVEDEIEAKRRAWELREVDLKQREELLQEKEHELEARSRTLLEKEKDATERMVVLDDQERRLSASLKSIEIKNGILQQEREEIARLKLDLQRSLDSLEDEKKQVDCAKENLETMKSETNELSVLEMKLKEEVDFVRTQKLELLVEEERLKAEKAKFESEWESIDEKREELRREADCLAQDRQAFTTFLKEERDNLRREKEAMRDQHKHDVESLHREREEFTNKMEQERLEWFNRLQAEQANFLLGIEMQKRELESSVEKRREEVEGYLRDKEKAFELEKRKELQHINSLREKAVEEMEQVALEMKKLETERKEINLDRKQREGDQAVLNRSIEELKVQTQNLEKQRELLHAERKEISVQLEHLNKLTDLRLALETKEVLEMQNSNMEAGLQKISARRHLKQQTSFQDAKLVSPELVDSTKSGNRLDVPLVKADAPSPHNISPFSWLKRCTELVFKNSSVNSMTDGGEKSAISDYRDTKLTSAGKLDSSYGYHGQNLKPSEDFGKRKGMISAFDEPKVILEVPHGGEPTVRSSSLESDSKIKEDADERMSKSISESQKLLQAGIKRHAETSLMDESVDSLAEQRQYYKRRRQGSINCRDASDQANAPGEQLPTDGVAEDTDLLTVDKIIKVSEVTVGMTDVDNFINPEKELQAPDSGPTSKKTVVEDGGTNGHINSTDVNNSVLPSGSEVPEMSSESHLKNLGHSTEPSQIQEGQSKQAVPVKTTGRRTRSKQKRL